MSRIEAWVTRTARQDLVVTAHHIDNGGSRFVLWTQLGATSTDVGWIFAKAMSVAVVYADMTDEDGWSSSGSNCSGGDCSSNGCWGIGRCRNDVALVCPMIPRGSLDGQFSDSLLLVFEVEVRIKI